MKILHTYPQQHERRADASYNKHGFNDQDRNFDHWIHDTPLQFGECSQGLTLAVELSLQDS